MTEASLRVLIVDDEIHARALLREYVDALPGVEVVGECADGFEAVKLTGELRPDLLLLDVQMPKLDGFEVLQLIEPGTAVVFVTAFDEYALRAFEVNAVDYLLKPFSRDRLGQALDRARTRQESQPPIDPTQLAVAARPEGEGLGRVVIKDGSQIHVVPVDRIDYVEAQGDYLAVHTEGVHHLKQQTLQSLESALDPGRFVRIHRSYLLNIHRLDRIEPMGKDSRVAVLTTGKTLPVSRSGYARLKELLG